MEEPAPTAYCRQVYMETNAIYNRSIYNRYRVQRGAGDFRVESCTGRHVAMRLSYPSAINLEEASPAALSSRP